MTKYYLMQGTTVLDQTFEPDNFKQAESYFITAGWFVKATIVRVDPYEDTQQMEYDYESKKVKDIPTE
jgi:hypothetical protein